MAMRRTICTHCGLAFNVPDNLAGKRAKCSGCGQAFAIQFYDPGTTGNIPRQPPTSSRPLPPLATPGQRRPGLPSEQPPPALLSARPPHPSNQPPRVPSPSGQPTPAALEAEAEQLKIKLQRLERA
ncbi:hypothetical protein KKB55_11115, partial [Myxococcota bacterium]|nr:hypothetical protein [Myxococcota bacterium]